MTSTLTIGSDPDPDPDPHLGRITDPRTPLCVAHRGASSTAPENTLASVRSAIAAGSDLVEVDVQRTRDRALVLLHDSTLERTTNVREVYPDRVPWRVSDFTLAELHQLDFGSWLSPAYAGEPVATLADTLALLRPGATGLLAELKSPAEHPGVVGELASELCGWGSGGPRVIVQSFDHQAMALLKAYQPGLEVGLTGKVRRAELAHVARWAGAVNPHHYAVDAAYVRAVQEAGMQCLVWTVNSSRSMRRALRLGVDGVITDRPADLRRLLDPSVDAVHRWAG